MAASPRHTRAYCMRERSVEDIVHGGKRRCECWRASDGPCQGLLDFATDVCPGGGARHGKQQGTQEGTRCRQPSLLGGLEQLTYLIP